MAELSVIDQIAAALRDSALPGDRISSWMCRWSLSRGQLLCNQCQAAQPVVQAGQAFNHFSGCVATRSNLYPLQELAALLGQLPHRAQGHVA